MTRGVVTDHLVSLIARQVDDHSLVVWYDPEGAYRECVTALSLPGTAVEQYDGSFFELRRRIDDMMTGVEPPRLVVYVPRERTTTHHALVELEAAGVVMQPGQQPPSHNTRLSLVARNALKGSLGEDTAAEVERQVDAGKLTLSDLNALANKGQDLSRGVVAVVFGSGNPQEVALAFLASDRLDGEVEKRSARTELLDLFRLNLGLECPRDAPLADVRERLARYVLLTDLVASLGEALPALASVKTAGRQAAEACVTLARNWRLRRDVRDSYVGSAARVEQQVSLDRLPLPAEKLAQVETFQAVERSLLRHVETALLDEPTEEMLTLARSRQSRFWAEAVPALQAHWALVVSAGEVLREADRVAGVLKKAPTTPADLVRAYAEGESPWCLLDTAHRHMESRWINFDPGQGNDTLEKLILKARQRYTQAGSDLARHFVSQWGKAKHPLPGLLRQCEVFDKVVRPALDRGKVAYVWVDALRYEMARELALALKEDFAPEIQPAVGTAPTITEVGMAALLPGAKTGRVEPAGEGKLGLRMGDNLLKDRKDRVAYLRDHAGVPVLDAKLDDLLPRPARKLKEGIQGAALVLVTSQEIDELCEKDNITQARRQMDGVLNDLRRGFRVLADLGVKTIVLAADHGHLFGEEVGEEMKIDAPGGETADLHRRVWCGYGGTVEPSYLRLPLASLGVESDLDLATPLGFAAFKVKGGARAYFHGGLSPQELVVPVVVMKPTAPAPTAGSIDWKLTPGSRKLSTRFFSVQVAGTISGLFAVEPPKVRVEVRAKGKCVSQPVSASYGFEEATGDVLLRGSEQNDRTIEPNTIAVMLVEEVTQKTVSVSLLDAATGTELASLDKIEVAISL